MRHDNISSPLCVEMETELSAFIDGELNEFQTGKVMEHLLDCDHCQSYVEHLRSFAHLHRSSADENEIVNLFNGSELYNNITSELIAEKLPKIADLFYQIGKTYLVKGLTGKEYGASSRQNKAPKISFDCRKSPMPLERTKMKAGRLFREIDSLAGSAKGKKTITKKHQQAKQFFKQNSRRKGDYLEIGRVFMEESLKINKHNPEPRILLGVYYYLGIRNYEKGTELFRKVLSMNELPEERRAEALINLGSIYSIQSNYKEAISCFREMVNCGIVKRHPRFYRCLIYLAITYAKLGEFEASLSTFDKTVRDFPRQAKQIKTDLRDMHSFQTVVKSEPGFLRSLEERVPVLFAS